MSDEMNVWALAEWAHPLEKIKQTIPEPQGREVLIKVTYASVCRSDLHTAEGFYDIYGGKRFYVKDRGIKLPVALGHEVLGEVVKAGPDAGSVQHGSLQVVYSWLGCGTCTRCSQEEDNLCAEQEGLGTKKNGGFVEYAIVPDPKYLFDLGNLDPAVACTLAVVE